MSIEGEILEATRANRLMAYSLEISAAYDALPWWRWLRCYHLQRQLRLISLCGLVYCHGQINAHESIMDAARRSELPTQ